MDWDISTKQLDMHVEGWISSLRSPVTCPTKSMQYVYSRLDRVKESVLNNCINDVWKKLNSVAEEAGWVQ